MRKVLMFMALASFLTASVTTSKACGDDKACAAKGKKASMSCCTKGAKATATKAAMDPNCKVKNGKDCTKDPNCVKEMSSKKSMKNCCAKDANKKS